MFKKRSVFTGWVLWLGPERQWSVSITRPVQGMDVNVVIERALGPVAQFARKIQLAGLPLYVRLDQQSWFVLVPHSGGRQHDMTRRIRDFLVRNFPTYRGVPIVWHSDSNDR